MRFSALLYIATSNAIHIIHSDRQVSINACMSAYATLASVPGRFFSKDTEGEKIRPGIYCIGDSAHVLTYSPESEESPFSFFDHVSIYVKQLSSLLRWLRRLAH